MESKNQSQNTKPGQVKKHDWRCDSSNIYPPANFESRPQTHSKLHFTNNLQK